MMDLYAGLGTVSLGAKAANMLVRGSPLHLQPLCICAVLKCHLRACFFFCLLQLHANEYPRDAHLQVSYLVERDPIAASSIRANLPVLSLGSEQAPIVLEEDMREVLKQASPR